MVFLDIMESLEREGQGEGRELTDGGGEDTSPAA